MTPGKHLYFNKLYFNKLLNYTFSVDRARRAAKDDRRHKDTKQLSHKDIWSQSHKDTIMFYIVCNYKYIR